MKKAKKNFSDLDDKFIIWEENISNKKYQLRYKTPILLLIWE